MSLLNNHVILIADAKTPSREALEALLKKKYQVLVASTGSQALEMVASHHPDLVLLDVALPDLDGYEICQRIKAGPGGDAVGVLFLAERCTEQDKVKGLKVGGADFIFKPCSPPLVFARVNNLLELKLSQEERRELSYLDELVDLPNRKRLDETLVNEWHRAVRYKRHLSLILIDVDHFAAYNEHFGEMEANFGLHQIAQSLNGTIHRPTDVLARYEEDTFACLLPETDPKGAFLIAERFRAAVESLGLPNPKASRPTVTVSVGWDSRVPDYERGAESLVIPCQEWLNLAKSQGRNQVCGPQERKEDI